MANPGDKPLPSIEPSQNGPYVVQHVERVTNSKGEVLETKKVIALCRCGRSDNKPFCDGTHAKVGFDDSRLTDGQLDKRENYRSGRLTIHDNRGICAHAGFCTDGLPSVFKLGKEPWIDPDAADEEAMIKQIHQCPSGALSYSIDREEHRDQERQPGIFVSRNGPYFVTGGIELKGASWGDNASEEHYTLCRCGGSQNKPFCDGTHWKGFTDHKN